jgi:outer membrane lipoprotein-sorting protein
MSNPDPSFYVVGGTLRADAPSYIERRADRDLLDGLLRGDFCYVLTPRQMGKSSLMVRTAQRLRARGVAVAALDLTAIGQNLRPEQWYDGLLLGLGRQLNLEEHLERFWQAHGRLGPCQRFFLALQEVVLPALGSPPRSLTASADGAPPAGATDGGDPPSGLVIFVDEIDTVRSLPFSTDEFFAAIRECYNRRSHQPAFQHLTFCLLGVATPTDLVNDPKTTPFNIGRRIELHDFTEPEAAPLAAGLQALSRVPDAPDPTAPRHVLRRVLYWTGGHPYLTQRLCRAAAEAAAAQRWVVGSEEFVDQVCNELFLSSRARERDDNLIFVRERLLRADVDLAALLGLYERIHSGKPVPDDPANPVVSTLRLSGITRVVEGLLDVRNRIYAQVFDRAWIAANMPGAELRRQRHAYRRGVLRGVALVAVALLLVAVGFLIFRHQRREHRTAQTIATLGAAYEGLRTYQDTAELQLSMQMEGAALTANGTCSVAFAKPNKLNLSLRMRFGLMESDLRLISDGTQAWLYLPTANRYVTMPAPEGLEPMIQAAGLAGLLAAPLNLYAIVSSEHPREELARRLAGNVQLVREELLDDQLTCQLVFEQQSLDPASTEVTNAAPETVVPRFSTQMWVTPEDGLVRQLLVDLSAVVRQAMVPNFAGGAPRQVTVQSYIMSSRHRQLRLNEPIPEEAFRFTPPAGAPRLDQLDAATLFASRPSGETEPLFDRARLAELIGPRAANAGPDLVDLSLHYNAPLTQAWHSGVTNNDLSALPRGLQTIQGIPFDLRGVVQLAGTAEPYLRRLFPEQRRDVDIQQRARRLHFLHACGWTATDGTPIGHYVVHYADGAQRLIPIIYGYDVRNWWPQPNEPAPASTGLILAWQSTPATGDPRRLYLTSWTNPRPEVPIRSLDYVSGMAGPAPFLVALTVEP